MIKTMEIAEYKAKKQKEMEKLLYDLIKNWEDEVVEFKEAGKDYDKEKIGQYFSALSNETNLRSLQYGWLVFGVNNKSREIVGSDYRNTEGLKTLKHEISQNVSEQCLLLIFMKCIRAFPEKQKE